MSQNDNNQKVIEKIKELRIKKNIAQNYIAQALGLTVSAYNRVENNKTQLTINNLYTIAQTLEVGVEELLQLNLKNMAQNYNNVVMTNFNNGELHISISMEQIKKMTEK